MGGLVAATALARAGHRVRVLEGRPTAGGLAAGFLAEGFYFDTAPYLLLDRASLEATFHALGADLAEHVQLVRLETPLEVSWSDGETLAFHADRAQTAQAVDARWPGAGGRYLRFLEAVDAHRAQVTPLAHARPASGWAIVRHGGVRLWRQDRRTLEATFRRFALPERLRQALSLFAKVAELAPPQAPAAFAWGWSWLHGPGAFYPLGGMGSIPHALYQLAVKAGVDFSFGLAASHVQVDGARVAGVHTDRGDFLTADVVVSNRGIGTYLGMLKPPVLEAEHRLVGTPLQSFGVATYLAVKGKSQPYVHYHLLPDGQHRVLVTPSAVDRTLEQRGRWPARLLAPMPHAAAQERGQAGQQALLDAVLEERWWRAKVEDPRRVLSRTSAELGSLLRLYRDSVNPAGGWLEHRSPFVRGLYLCGSATYPGPSVTACAHSGVLAASRVLEDFPGAQGLA